MATSPAKESVAAGASTETETSISTEEVPHQGQARDVEPVPECEPSSEKYDKQTDFSADIAVTKALSQIDNAETNCMEAMKDLKAVDAHLQEKKLENAEITLVVEVSTDAESTQDGGGKKEEILDRGGVANSSVQALEQVVGEDSEMRDPGISPEAAHCLMEENTLVSIRQESLDSSISSSQKTPQVSYASSKTHETAGRELERIDIQGEVVGEKHTSLPIPDELESLENKAKEAHSLAELQVREASVTNEEGMTKQDVCELAEMEVEGNLGFRLCRKRAAEEVVEDDGLCTTELSERLVGGDKKKGRVSTWETLQLAEQSRAAVLSDPFTLNEAKDETNFVQCLESDVREDGTDISKEQAAGSMMVQTELSATYMRREQESLSMSVQMEQRVDRTNLEAEGVPPASTQSLEGQDRVQEGATDVEGNAVLTEEVTDKDEMREVAESPVPMDTGIAIDRHVEFMGGEGSQGGRQELLYQKVPGISGKNLGIGIAQSDQDMEIGAGMRGKQNVMEEKKSHQGIDGAAEKYEMDGSMSHIEVRSSNELSKGEKVGQETQREEATPELYTQVSSAVEISHTDVVQTERQQNQKVHTEMHVRLAETSHEELEGSLGRVERALLEVKEDEPGSSSGQHWRVGIVMKVKSQEETPVEGKMEGHVKDMSEERQGWASQGPGYNNAVQQSGRRVFEEEKTGLSDEANTGTSEEERFFGGQLERGSISEKASQKRKLSDNFISDSGAANEPGQSDNVVKKAKKKAVNVWAKSTSRKGPKKNSKNGGPQIPPSEDSVLLTPVYVNPDKVEDGPDQPIALSKYDKAEKIELSENRLSASSTKGYRMVRATRGVQEGTWYYEIVVDQLGPTGHTRLGWSTQKGDVQAPVGFDSNSYGYRDLDGSKTHVAIREPYGDLYVEGDVIGFYIHLPNGADHAPKPAPLLSYRGRPYLSDIKEEEPMRVPGSEICFFRNGVCQGTAFKDIFGGRYFPAASMYTLPKEPNCTVRFNFGPDFQYPPVDLDGRPAPKAMVHAPYHNALGGKEVGPVAYASVSATGLGTQNIEPQMNMA